MTNIANAPYNTVISQSSTFLSFQEFVDHFIKKNKKKNIYIYIGDNVRDILSSLYFY